MQKSDAPQKNIWIILAIILVVIVLVGVLAYAMLTASGFIKSPEPTQPAVFITITEPDPGTNLDLIWAVSVKGEAGGLFEGNVVVQALDAAGNVIAQQPTIIAAADAGVGGSGPWSVDLNIHAPAGSQGQIVAFSTSPEDGSWVAEDRIEVGYGESPIKRELVKVEDHLWRLYTLNERPPIGDTLITLQFENFQAAGFGGCNNFRTSFERRGSSLNFGFVTSTAKECELPIGVMAQESAYFSALEQITAIHIGGQQLSMVDNLGIDRLVYDAVVMGNIIGAVDAELPEDALVFVQLIDISFADTEAGLITEQVITGVTQFPVPYSLNYNPKQIIDDHTYALDVHIEDSAGNLLFTNPTVYYVITKGNPFLINVEVESVQE
jgi:putative lipoprotein